VIEQAGGRLATIRIDAAAESVRRTLADEGSIARRWSRRWSRPTTRTVHAGVFAVDAGPRQRIGRIKVIGDRR
jgi:hypothetical protein